MHLRNLDLNLLVALDALLTTQNVSLAAQQLSVTQSTMSGALARLRLHFGDALLTRSGRGMVLTPFARELVEPVKTTISGATKIAQLRPGFDPARSERTFAVVASDYSIAVFIPALLVWLAERAPGITLNISVRAPGHEQRFALGLIDFVLAPERLIKPGHPTLRLFEDDYVCIACARNPMLQTGITPDQFAALRHVIRINPAAQEQSGDERALRSRGVERRVAATVPTFEMLARMVVGTPWIATIQRRLATQQGNTSAIRVFEHPLDLPRIAMCLQWPETLGEDPANKWLREQFSHVSASSFS